MMEEGGVKCWLSMSIFLSGAVSGASLLLSWCFFFSLLLADITSDSRTATEPTLNYFSSSVLTFSF